ncbi:YybH family protein [Lacinutrix jangbogonensis]|uniref:YybH family protein n=1 Tax=Lacinutrix jangbogonensis TaxID=1469557 RepID=UPI00053DE7B6|nr:nuclear transport factor 2 family protein [Lacinutrix jangbogonensis]
MKYTLILIIALSCFNCNTKTEQIEANIISQEGNEKEFNIVLNKHLEAVSKKNLEAMKSTLTPNGNMQLILPSTEPTNTNTAFINYHKEWFAAPIQWSFKTKILNTNIGETLGMAIVEVVYSEPLRNGKPYFNRMIVSYDLEKTDGKWYFIKDHASSIKKSTDL